jgi:threonine synthase
MRFISTRGLAPAVDFRTALFEGLAPDGGLYMPQALEPLPPASLNDVGVARSFVGDDIPADRLEALLAEALNFPIPLVRVRDGLTALELYHGPTFAFKDVGARVMARLMAHFHTGRDPLTVLVATSGDTGSAVAQAFFGVEGTRVVVLFPEGQVSRVQEAQFTTLGGNVTAVAVTGTFDDCQRLVKEAFADRDLRARARLTSANSINIGRLLPQILYYVRATAGLTAFAEASAVKKPRHDTRAEGSGGALAPPERAVFSVPSGNFGNLTAGLLAWKLGAPIHGFVAATTVNDTLPRYLATGRYEPRPSVATLANAMDVGHPSNVERIRWLFHDDIDAMRRTIATSVHTDADVRAAIAELWNEYEYLADPHTAIGYLGTKQVDDDRALVFLATAHPAKFREVVEPIIGQSVPLPPSLDEALRKPRQVQRIQPAMGSLRPLLSA